MSYFVYSLSWEKKKLKTSEPLLNNIGCSTEERGQQVDWITLL